MDPLPVRAQVVGKLPLSTPDWHNPWKVDPALALPDPARWDEVVRLYLEGDLNAAALALEAMAADGFDEVTVRRNLAVVYKDLGEYRLAAQEYQRLATLDPQDARIRSDWGFALLGAGETDAAFAVFRDALSLRGASAFDEEEAIDHFGLGLVHYVRGERERAVAALERAVEINPGLAAAYDLLGALYLEEGNHEAAVAALGRALRLDSGFVLANYRLAQSHEALGRIREAWTYYDRSRRILSGRSDVQRDFVRFVDAHHGVIQRVEKERVEARRRAAHIRVTPLPVPQGTLLIRVGLLEGSADFLFSAGSPFHLEFLDGRAAGASTGVVPGGKTDTVAGAQVDDVRDVDGNLVAGKRDSEPLSAGQWRAVFDHEGERGLVLEGPQGERVAVGRRDVRLTPIDPAATMILYDLETGQGYFWSVREDLQVRGSLEFLVRPAGITVVNLIDIESYLLAVVPSEMYPSMGAEALKAQAIAARTYTLRSRGRFGARGFDVMGTVVSSAYRGVAREQPATTAAVMATMGQVLTYRGSLANTVYSASAGGFSASSEEAWGGGQPYLQAGPEWAKEEEGPNFPLAPSALENWLRGIPDVYSSRTPVGPTSAFRWMLRVEAHELERRVNRVASIGRIEKIIPGPRGIGGYVKSVTIVGSDGTHVVRGDSIRSTLGGLRSNAFKVQAILGPDGLPESFLFFGAGFGHGVGLSQYGAAGMAQEGKSAEEILAHYYPGTVIRPDYNR